MYRKIVLLLLLTGSCFFKSWSQSDTFIKGTLLDSLTSEPLAFASIKIG
jgi:hypothetical protein